MTYEEYDVKIKDVLSNPDTAQANILGVMDALKGDLENAASLVAENEKLKDRIRDLQDTNAKLFLGTTSKSSEPASDDGDDLTGADALNHFVDTIMKGD